MAKRETPFGFGVHPDPEPNDDLAKLLASLAVPPWNPDVRANLRARFVEPPTSPSAPQSLGKALREFKAPEPSAAFLAERKADFLAGATVDPGASEEKRLSALAQPSRQRGIQTPPDAARKRVPWKLLVPALALVLAAWMLGPWRANEADLTTPLWSLASAIHDESKVVELRIDGERWSGKPAELAQRLAHARRIASLEDQPVRLVFGRLFQVALAAESELEVRTPLTGEPSETMQLGLLGRTGGVVIQTGPDFHPNGHRLRFHTHETEVEVTGTVFAIDCYEASDGFPGGTCVCCSEGAVEVRTGAAGFARAGESIFVFANQDPPCHQAIPKGHGETMEQLVAARKPAAWLP